VTNSSAVNGVLIWWGCYLTALFLAGSAQAQIPLVNQPVIPLPIEAIMNPEKEFILNESPKPDFYQGSWRDWHLFHSAPDVPDEGPPVFGVVGLRGFAMGTRVAPNGVPFTPIFDLEMNFNIWISRKHHVYLFADGSFWAQKAAPGITNAKQGSFDFSKREIDLALGAAWNYWGRMEGRFSAYSLGNINRGKSQVAPSGFADGTLLENRWYIGQEYDNLGTSEYDIPRANFVSIGYFPTKHLVDNTGHQFKPGAYMRAYLTADLFSPQYYIYSDSELIANRSFELALFKEDAGFALRPFLKLPRLEFRLGTTVVVDAQNSDSDTSLYGMVRFVY
jgi:hypothetical protein